MTEFIIHIDEEKKPLISELVKQLGGTIEEKKTQLIDEIKEAVKELNDVKNGKKKARNAEDFLNELHG